MIRNFLTPGDIADSIAKTLAAQQRSLDFLAQVVLDNRIIFQLSKEESVLWPTSHAAPGLTLLGKLKLGYITSLSKPLGLRGDSYNWVIL